MKDLIDAAIANPFEAIAGALCLFMVADATALTIVWLIRRMK